MLAAGDELNDRSEENMSRTLLINLLAGAGVVVAVGLGTMLLLHWLATPRNGLPVPKVKPFASPTEPPSPSGLLQPALGKPIILSGDATASTAVLKDNTAILLPGEGFARIEGTSGLQCLTHKCSLSAIVEFEMSLPIAGGHVIVGQTNAEQPGWYLYWTYGYLYLQGNGEMAIPFTPNARQRYTIQITSEDQQVTALIDGNVAGTTKQSPFVDVPLDVTVGGRTGSSPYFFIGAVSNLRITTSP